MEPWVIILFGIILIGLTIFGANGRKMLTLVLRVVGAVLIGFGLKSILEAL